MFDYTAETSYHGQYQTAVKCPKCGKTMYVSPDLVKWSDGHYKCPYCGSKN